MDNSLTTPAVTENSLARPEMSASDRRREALFQATKLFQQRVDWLRYFREVLGVDGIVRQLFPNQAEFLAFEQTDEFAEIEKLMFRLKADKVNPRPNHEPTRVITVRLPESIHEALRAEASDHNTSINKLCISKLLLALNEAGAGDEEIQAAQTALETNRFGRVNETPLATQTQTSQPLRNDEMRAPVSNPSPFSNPSLES